MVTTTIKKYIELREAPVVVSTRMIPLGAEIHEDVYDWCSSTPVMLDLDGEGEIVSHRLVTSLEV